MAGSQGSKISRTLRVGGMVCSLPSLTATNQSQASVSLCMQNMTDSVLHCPIMLHEQQFEKIQRLASHVSEEACTS